MSFTPSWRRAATGWFPILADDRAACLHCKGKLVKLHGLNKNPDNFGRPLVMSFFAFGAGPWCLHCAVKEAWQQKDFFQRPGSDQYDARRYDLNVSLRPKLPSIEEELKNL